MSLSESGIDANWGPAVNLNQLVGGVATIAGGGVLAVATASNWPVLIGGFCSVLYGVTLIVKAWIERDGRHKDDRIRQLEAELARRKYGEAKI